MEGFLQDARFGARALARRPAFTAVAATVLALGIGANVVMASLTAAVLYRPLPFGDPDRLMLVWRDNRLGDRTPFSIPTYRDWAARDRSFSPLAAFRSSSAGLTGTDGEPERLRTLQVTADFVAVLGVEPVLGRGFAADDDRLGADRTAMVSWELWQRRFAGDPSLLGRSLALDGELYTVIGVFPAGLAEEVVGLGPLGDLWVPLSLFFDRLPVEERANHSLVGAGRLRAGTTLAAAQSDLSRIMRELAEEYPDVYRANDFVPRPIREDSNAEARPTLRLLVAAVALVLLVAASNVANLLLTRLRQRDRELAVRQALGAGRRRLAAQMVTESLVLAAVAAVLGLVIARLGLSLLPRLGIGISGVDTARSTAVALAVTAVMTVLLALGTGVVPTLQVIRNLRSGWLATGLGHRGATPSRGRLMAGLVTVEVALALVLAIGAGLLVRSMTRLRAQDPGFDPNGVLTLQVTLPETRHRDYPAWLSFFDQALPRLTTLPGVDAVAVASSRPLEGNLSLSILAAGDRPLPPVPEMSVASYQMVSPGYFAALGIPLVAGRDVAADDDDRRDAEKVAVISAALAERFWPGASPLGKTLAFEFDGTPKDPHPRWRRIVGVVGDARASALREAPRDAVYVPYAQRPLWAESESPPMTFFLRTSGDPVALVGAARAGLREVAPEQPTHSVCRLDELIEAQLDRPRMASRLFSVFAGLALVLAVVGVYGVVALTITGRRQEIAVRIALGGRSRQVLRRLVVQSSPPIVVGLVLGVGLTAAAAKLTAGLTSSILYDVPLYDPATYLTSVVAVALAALAATLVPAWRASRLDPSSVLRAE